MGFTTKDIPFKERKAELMLKDVEVTGMSHTLRWAYPHLWQLKNMSQILHELKICEKANPETVVLSLSDDNRAFITFGGNFIECKFLKPQIDPRRRLFGISHVKDKD